MERLTFWSNDNNDFGTNTNKYKNQEHYYRMVQKLGEYENIGTVEEFKKWTVNKYKLNPYQIMLTIEGLKVQNKELKQNQNKVAYNKLMELQDIFVDMNSNEKDYKDIATKVGAKVISMLKELEGK